MKTSHSIQVEILEKKIRHYLITTMGKTLNDATDQEVYKALVWSLREEVLINWAALKQTHDTKKVRKAHYLSMEYMPGRLFENNCINLSQIDLIGSVLHSISRSFSNIIAQEREIAIGNGGLGRLASCFLDSIATLEYPAMGYGLRYQYGIFQQSIVNGIQIERPDPWLLSDNPWEFRRDDNAVTIDFNGSTPSSKEEVRALPYDIPIVGFSTSSDFRVATLRMWSTKESPLNFSLQKFNAGETGPASENTALTDVLYPNDNNDVGKRIRLKQEFLLVSASLQDIVNNHVALYGSIAEFEDKVRIQINDTHPSLAIPELIRILTVHHSISFEAAFEITKTCCSYTNHTVLKEALEEWDQEKVKTLLPEQFAIIERIEKKLRKSLPSDNSTSLFDGTNVQMAYLTVYGSHTVNGVAKLHSELIKETIFKDLYALWPEKFTNVTNGVTQRRWLLTANPQLSTLLMKHIGCEWITNFHTVKKIAAFKNDTSFKEKLLSIKEKNKLNLCEYIANKEGVDKNSLFLPPTALYDIHIKRIHEYKRQLMNILHTIMIYHELQDNPQSDRIARMSLYAGKAAPGYELAKAIITLINAVSRKIKKSPRISSSLRVLFLENYNVSLAEKLIPAADISQQISTASTEASGTGNMKLTINGALTIGTEDGANIEMRESIGDEYWPFSFGASAKENLKTLENGEYSPSSILEKEPQLKRAVNSLLSDEFITNENEKKAFQLIHDSLLKGMYGGPADKYFVLKDMMSYYEAQKRVEKLYTNKEKWYEYVTMNIAGMGPFSSDNAIHTYAQSIWDIAPCPIDPSELVKVRNEYETIDQCRLY